MYRYEKYVMYDLRHNHLTNLYIKTPYWKLYSAFKTRFIFGIIVSNPSYRREPVYSHLETRDLSKRITSFPPFKKTIVKQRRNQSQNRNGKFNKNGRRKLVYLFCFKKIPILLFHYNFITLVNQTMYWEGIELSPTQDNIISIKRILTIIMNLWILK